MVSGSSFVQLVNSFQDVMKNYSSLLSDVSTSWRGTSYDSLVSKCGDFINSYVDTISSVPKSNLVKAFAKLVLAQT